MWKNELESNRFPEKYGKVEIIIPSEHMFFECAYIYKQKGFWKSWSDLLKTQQKASDGDAIQVPTIDTLRYNYFLDLHIKVSFQESEFIDTDFQFRF